jgi:nitroreductase
MIALLRHRRSIRKFTSLPVENDKVQSLAEALLRAPTSRNLQPCQFIMVNQPDLLQQLSTAKPHGAALIKGAPLAVVIAADPSISDVWIEDASIAAITVQYAAETLGLKSCWIQLRQRSHNDQKNASDFVRGLVNLPVGFEVPMLIAIGYPAEDKKGHPEETLAPEKIHFNSYP